MQFQHFSQLFNREMVVKMVTKEIKENLDLVYVVIIIDLLGYWFML